MSVRKREWNTAAGEQRSAFVVDYTDANGKRRSETFSKKKDAVAREAEVKVNLGKGVHVPRSSSVTVKQAGEQWIAAGTVDHLERSTLDQRRQHVAHILPLVGRLKLADLNVAAVRDFRDRLRAEGRSEALTKKIMTSLSSILSDAQQRGQIGHNVVREMPKRRRTSDGRDMPRLKVGATIPEPTEIRLIVEHAKPRFRPMFVLAAFSGLRASELRGLCWRHCDLKEGLVHVEQRADRYNQIGPPKSKGSTRAVPVGDFVVNTLKDWRDRCPNSGDDDLVFGTRTNKPNNHRNVILQGFHPAQIAAGVVDEDGKAKYGGLHCLRHFYASWCINRVADGGLGLPPKNVQERLGHATLAMTMDTYGHLFKSADDRKSLGEAERRLMAINAT